MANQTSSFGNPRAKYSRLHITGYGIRRPVSSSFAAVNTQSFRRKLSSGAGSRLQPWDRDFLARREKEENYAKAQRSPSILLTFVEIMFARLGIKILQQHAKSTIC